MFLYLDHDARCVFSLSESIVAFLYYGEAFPPATAICSACIGIFSENSLRARRVGDKVF